MPLKPYTAAHACATFSFLLRYSPGPNLTNPTNPQARHKASITHRRQTEGRPACNCRRTLHSSTPPSCTVLLPSPKPPSRDKPQPRDCTVPTTHADGMHSNTEQLTACCRCLSLQHAAAGAVVGGRQVLQHNHTPTCCCVSLTTHARQATVPA